MASAFVFARSSTEATELESGGDCLRTPNYGVLGTITVSVLAGLLSLPLVSMAVTS
jgi:hypothetical protein